VRDLPISFSWVSRLIRILRTGHLLGLDTHDVGGLPEGKSTDPLLRYLRLRVPLEEGFVVTVEPGCYFNQFLFAPFENSEFVNHDLLQKYLYVGGVRIEDKYVFSLCQLLFE